MDFSLAASAKVPRALVLVMMSICNKKKMQLDVAKRLFFVENQEEKNCTSSSIWPPRFSRTQVVAIFGKYLQVSFFLGFYIRLLSVFQF